jgi:hypothetical protein
MYMKRAMEAPDDVLLNQLASLGNHTLHRHWHKELCDCPQPDNCPRYPADTWNIAESLRIVLPELLNAYNHAKEQQ